jgi:putative hemin transport protein
VAVLPASGSVPGFIFFNSAGVPVHRILLTETSNVAEFDAIVAQFKGEAPALDLKPVEAPEVVPPTEETKAALLEGWRKMQDTHEFSGLLNTHKVSRIDAARIAEGEFTAQLDPTAYDALFEQLMKQEAAIMFFAMNDGCVQISTGAITEINRTRGTLQLVEDDSRTLVSLPRIAQVWRVSKPTERGLIHSLELYDANGEILALLFGSEKGDSTSIVKWKELLFALPLAGEGAVKVAGETAEAPAAL